MVLHIKFPKLVVRKWLMVKYFIGGKQVDLNYRNFWTISHDFFTCFEPCGLYFIFMIEI